MKAKYTKILEENQARAKKIVDTLKNEKLGLVGQTHNLKQLTAEMRTENGDLRT